MYPYTTNNGHIIEYFNLNQPNQKLTNIIHITNCPTFHKFENQILTNITNKQNINVTNTILLILNTPKNNQTIYIQFIINETNIETNLTYHNIIINSNNIPTLQNKPHPKLFNTFPQILKKYVHKHNLLTLPKTIQQITSLSTSTFNINSHSHITEKCFTNLILFNTNTVHNTTTYNDPKREPKKISLIIINNTITLKHSQHTTIGSKKMLQFHNTAHNN